jgi:hypothetical protein
MVFNKSLKAFAALTWTVQTGAASHCRAGSSCPLALRYMPMQPKAKIWLIITACKGLQPFLNYLHQQLSRWSK